MAIVNPYDPGTPVPLPTYTGAPGDWSAMMKWKPWELLDMEQDPTFNPQWLPNLSPWLLPKEKIKDDIPIVKTTVADEWDDPDKGNGTNGNGPNGTNGTITNGGTGDIIWTDPDTGESIVYGVDTGGTGTEDVTGISTGAVVDGTEEGYPGAGTAIDQGLLDAQALADAQAAALADEQAQALAAQQAADALASQQAVDAQAASDALLEEQRLEDERIRQQQEAAAEERQALEDAAYGRVSTAKDQWGRDHWESTGKSEGRDLPGDFGDYVESYPALKEAYLEHRKSLKEDEPVKEEVATTVAPLWMQKPDGTWGWVNPLTFEEEKYLWTDTEETGGIAPTGTKGTQLAGASGWPRWVPNNPYATITPSSMGTVYGSPSVLMEGTGVKFNMGLPSTYQQWLDRGY